MDIIRFLFISFRKGFFIGRIFPGKREYYKHTVIKGVIL